MLNLNNKFGFEQAKIIDKNTQMGKRTHFVDCKLALLLISCLALPTLPSLGLQPWAGKWVQ